MFFCSSPSSHVYPSHNPHPFYLIPFLGDDDIVINDLEPFERGTFRNRTSLLSSQGLKKLSIPIKKPEPFQKYSEVQIDNNQTWSRDHWGFIYSNYGKAPFFPELVDKLQTHFTNPGESLFQFNLKFLKFCLDFISPGRRIDLLSNISPNMGDFKGPTAPHKVFSEPVDKNSLQFSYPQLFGRTFVNDLGVLDLVMNEGPSARLHIKRMAEQFHERGRF